MRDRRNAFRSRVLRMVSVSESLCTTGAEICERFASSNAISASWVSAEAGAAWCTAVGNNWRTAELGRNALWKMLECFFNGIASDAWHVASSHCFCLSSPSQESRSCSVWPISSSLTLSVKRTDRLDVSSSDVMFEVSSHWKQTKKTDLI